MPIEVHVVSESAYQTWLADAKKQFAHADGIDLSEASQLKP